MSRIVTGALMGDPPPGRSALDLHTEAEQTDVAVVRYRPPPAEEIASEPLPVEVEQPAEAAEEAAPARELRAVVGICTADLALADVPTGPPVCMDVDPRTLLVDEAYQRDLGEKSLALIRKIATGWDWRKFKPPIVVLANEGPQVIDGQHTAIGAASRPDILTIPVMVIEAEAIEARAAAFIGHNRDRLQVSGMQLHHAAVAAGDETAQTIEKVCDRAGVRLVRSTYGGYRYKPGETIAIGAIKSVIDRRGAQFSRRILQALVLAERAPILAAEIKAAEMLFTGEDYVSQLEPLNDEEVSGGSDLAQAIKALGDTAEREAKVFAAAQCVPYWRALAITWFKKTRKRRKA